MKNFAAACALLTALVVATPGCYKTLDNRSRAGVPFKKDKIGGQYERTLDQVQTATRKVLQFNGTLVSDDVIGRVLVGKVDTRTVYVKLIEVEPNLTAVTVQVRTRGGLSDLDLAAEIDKQIALNLK
ncbi:MAG: hypothetical protein IT580_21370 [Verrucomicrobiales bacterium]|nr:hypothetical protein [Verrucomicrobiales bacterium]